MCCQDKRKIITFCCLNVYMLYVHRLHSRRLFLCLLTLFLICIWDHSSTKCLIAMSSIRYGGFHTHFRCHVDTIVAAKKPSQSNIVVNTEEMTVKKSKNLRSSHIFLFIPRRQTQTMKALIIIRIEISDTQQKLWHCVSVFTLDHLSLYLSNRII